jgi:hypothetical protein
MISNLTHLFSHWPIPLKDNTHKNPIAQNQVKANDAHDDCFAQLSDWIISICLTFYTFNRSPLLAC